MDVNDTIIVPGEINNWGEDLKAIVRSIEYENENTFIVAQYIEPTVNSGYTIRCNIQLIKKSK